MTTQQQNPYVAKNLEVSSPRSSFIRTVQELLGYKDVCTTMIYLQVMNKPGLAVKSPADVIGES
ncbi:MAG: hypothetical protein P8K08_06495 [Fuerstiella sp.]|jgi:hypothetical protein|nr:hypothetical protein [Fuerstiella sp.]